MRILLVRIFFLCFTYRYLGGIRNTHTKEKKKNKKRCLGLIFNFFQYHHRRESYGPCTVVPTAHA